jgi:hypothetical protein
VSSLKYKTIIGFGHQMQVGKDAAAAFLVQEHGFTQMRFADALKDVCSLVFGWSREDMEDASFKQTEDPFWEITPRRALQLIGTDAMRNNIRQDIWVKALERKIRSTFQQKYVITDVRFPNEAEAILRWGGHVIRIDRPGYSSEDLNRHASETALLGYGKWSGVIQNDGTEAELRDKVRAELQRLQVQLPKL